MQRLNRVLVEPRTIAQHAAVARPRVHRSLLMQLNSIIRPSLLVAAAGVLALGTSALGVDRDHHDRGDRGGGRSGLSVGIGFSNRGSGFSIGVGDRRGFRGDAFFGSRSYCGPAYSYPLCGPAFYSRPYYAPRYDYCWPTIGYSEVIVDRPVYVDRPVVVQRDVVVEAPAPQQVYAQQPVYTPQPASVQQPAPQIPVAMEVRQNAPAQTTQGTYRDRELGDAYLRMGDPENAVRTYSKYLTAWNADGTVNRNLGFAQIAKGEVQDGFRAVVRGYTLEPSLVERPLSIDELGGKMFFQRILDGAARGAAGSNTSEAWLTVAILQNVAGQKDAAINALQRSRDAGLDKALLDSFTLELSKQK